MLTRETLKTKYERAKADLLAAGADLSGSDLDILAFVHAGGMYELDGRLEWAARQMIPDLADPENQALWARRWGITPKAASKAKGPVNVTGQSGAVVPAATPLQIGSVRYTVDANSVLAAGAAALAVTAQDAGTTGNAAQGAAIQFIAPVAGINQAALVGMGGLTGGTDQETAEQLLDRQLERMEEPPHGGNDHDYVTWAKEIAGVTRAWCFPLWGGPGTVGVTIMADGQGAGALAIPGQAMIDAVKSRILGTDGIKRNTGKAPVPIDSAKLFVFAPTAKQANFTIQAVTPNTQVVRDAITANLTALINAEASPGQQILVSHVHEAISLAAGETDHVLVSPTANITANPGELIVMGAITWQ